ncbi:hypothetical protein ASPCADRAFT_2406 [Aspergillus carbonarius ITEM 5010]|uniref:Uncharacterized protein n=1 Tax=Aspergillus carbonarius (strain ITEM 5010) TaxID=602072 RepID=A0A1R3RWY1_ASPC5|nr:hypothetical protein ASPCADRAFT_2406 [Aspergillus carbonarius ITEM 5010]
MSEPDNRNVLWARRWQQIFPSSNGFGFEAEWITINGIQLEIVRVTRVLRNQLTLVMVVGDSRDDAQTPTYNACLEETVGRTAGIRHYGFTIRDHQLRTFERSAPDQPVRPWFGHFQAIIDYDRPSTAILSHLNRIILDFRRRGRPASPGLWNDPGPSNYLAFLIPPQGDDAPRDVPDDAPTDPMPHRTDYLIERGGVESLIRESNVRTREPGQDVSPWQQLLQRLREGPTANPATNIGVNGASNHITNGISAHEYFRPPPPPDSDTDEDTGSG